MPTSTTNYGLIKPGTDDPILIGQINDNMDTVDTVLKDHSDKIDAAALGIKFKGEVNYYSNLPNDAEIGDAYTVKYAGSSGTTPDGTEYVWGAVSGVNQWINFSKDSYSKAEVDALLALKQNALSSTQLDAVNSGIDSTKVAQIETNKNNISTVQTQTNWNSNNGVKNILDYVGFSSNNSAGLSTFTTKGVTYKKNADGTISAYTTNTGASGNAYCYICDDSGIINIKQYFDGKHILSCDTYSANHYVLFYKIDSETSVAVNGDTLLPNRNDISTAYIILQVYSGEIISESTPIVFNPMIRLSSISDPTYQPYAMSNAELTAAIQALQAQLANQ